MLNIAHSTGITTTAVTFKLSFASKVTSVTLSNEPNIQCYGNIHDLTKAGFTLHTSRASGATAVNMDYYSIAIGY